MIALDALSRGTATPTILVLLCFAICSTWLISRSSLKPKTITGACEKRAHDVYEDLTPLADLQWQSVEPLKIRPFKNKYHLTMGLESLALSDLVAVDRTYLERIKLRRHIMTSNVDATLACNPVAEAAVLELHKWMFGTYLPRRLPTMFQLSIEATGTKNMVTGEMVSIDEPTASEALQNLGSHVDTDFLLLLPSSVSSEGQPVYHLEAFVTCFPSGFSTRSKLSKSLADIHEPVPGYAAKLERSMNRYFARIGVGSIVKRANWTITTTDALFTEAGTHMYSGDASDEDTRDVIRQEREAISIERCKLRAERQTLHRLPVTRALVFAFKTYQYRLADVKAEGDGPALADAIEGLAKGSVPEMHHYKRGVVWGDVLAKYLRE